MPGTSELILVPQLRGIPLSEDVPPGHSYLSCCSLHQSLLIWPYNSKSSQTEVCSYKMIQRFFRFLCPSVNFTEASVSELFAVP